MTSTRQTAILAVAQPFIDRATVQIRDKVEDALAHAERCLTKTAIAEEAGRPTLRRIDWSKSYEAACNRFADLLESLAGPSRASRKGTIRDAFAATYSQAFQAWRVDLDPAILDPRKTEPVQSDLNKARTIVLLGYDARDYLLPLLDGSAARLKALLASLASPNRTRADQSDLLAAWARTTRDTLTSRATLFIRTGAAYLDRVAGRDVVRPELLHDDPTVPTR